MTLLASSCLAFPATTTQFFFLKFFFPLFEDVLQFLLPLTLFAISSTANSNKSTTTSFAAATKILLKDGSLVHTITCTSVSNQLPRRRPLPLNKGISTCAEATTLLPFSLKMKIGALSKHQNKLFVAESVFSLLVFLKSTAILRKDFLRSGPNRRLLPSR